MSLAVIIWIIAIAAFLTIEAATVSLVSLWFVGGSFCAMVAAILGASWLVQFAVFVLVSAALLALVRPLVRKYVSPKATRTNADRLIGRQALVTEDIDNLTAKGVEVLWDDRPVSAGVMFSDADLAGIPVRVVVSPKGLKNGTIEISMRDKSMKEILPADQAEDFVYGLVVEELNKLDCRL